MQVNFQIPEEHEDTWEQFKSFVLRNEGKLRGELGKHVGQALNHYMDSMNHDKEKKVLTGKRNISLKRSYQIWCNLDFEVDERFPEPVLERTIREVAGASHVTVKKYKGLMQQFNLITRIGPNKEGTVIYEKWPKPDWVEQLE